jgi:transaldolase
MTNPLRDLNKAGQSIWYDNLNRELIISGKLRKMVDEDGVTGGTSNPSIFEKAIASGSAYDDHIRELLARDADIPVMFDALTVADVQQSADVFRPAYDATRGADGHASLEVSPHLAYDTQATVNDARRLFQALDRPNVMIKIPGTPEGLPAIEQCLSEGLNINITLLFSVESYEQVANAYIAALEKRAGRGEPVDCVASVASFFVSRVDTLTDEKLNAKIEAAGSEAEKAALRALTGKAAVANARIAYQKFRQIFSGPRWQALADKGARVQRCLWASTSTKNPEYRDVIYVEELIGPDTVNTLPQSTLDAFRDHGRVELTLGRDIDAAHETIRRIEEAGISFKGVTDELQTQGVQLFCDSFDKAVQSIVQKREVLRGAGARA